MGFKGFSFIIFLLFATTTTFAISFNRDECDFYKKQSKVKVDLPPITGETDVSVTFYRGPVVEFNPDSPLVSDMAKLALKQGLISTYQNGDVVAIVCRRGFNHEDIFTLVPIDEGAEPLGGTRFKVRNNRFSDVVNSQFFSGHQGVKVHETYFDFSLGN